MRPQDPFIGRDILEGQFQIVQKIGSGGMGAVYRAVQPAMNRMVAVKILHPKLTTRKDIVSRFRREARAMSQLTHPNTVKVFLYGELDNGSLYIVMEFLEGKNLNQSVRSEGAFAMDRALTILIAVCGALDEAHNAGIIHRDLKPENVFLCQSAGLKDFPKVLDFGLAKVGERQMRPGSVVLTQEGMVFGTPEFMSPEQAQGKTLTPASDIYSLAVILYEVLTGKLPFDAKAALDFIQLHVQAPPIKLSERVAGKTFPPLLDAIMERALAKKPEDRFTTAAQFAEALQVVLRGATALPPHLALPATSISQPSLPTTGPAKPVDHGGKLAPMPPLPGAAESAGKAMHKKGDGQASAAAQPVRPAARSNVGMLVIVAVVSLGLGVVLALVVLKLMK